MTGHAPHHPHDDREHPEHETHGHRHSQPHDDHEHGEHDHDHPGGVRGFLTGLFAPHSHDAADSIDDALQASTDGIRAVKISVVVLGATAVAQLAIAAVPGRWPSSPTRSTTPPTP